jgi:Rrf2 family protein
MWTDPSEEQILRLSSLADYAVVLMRAASRHCGSSALGLVDGKRRGRISATDLAEETGIPLPTAQKIVSLMTRAGLMKSVRGTGGGIMLARPAAAISLAEIIEAVEGPIALTACVESGKHSCALEGTCATQPHWGAVNQAVRGALGGVTLASLSMEARI